MLVWFPQWKRQHKKARIVLDSFNNSLIPMHIVLKCFNYENILYVLISVF